MEMVNKLDLENRRVLNAVLAIGIVVSCFALGAKSFGVAGVVGILSAIGIYRPPKWLVWAILGAGTVSVVVAIITTAGWATIPAWAAWALIGADSFSA